MDDGEVPPLIPARMVNEAAYCPRLFFLEWAQAAFEDSADTVDGRYQHRVVDQPTGKAPPPESAQDLKVARSVMLSSTALGLVGKVDLLEGVGSSVTPVDYKRGRAPANALRSWEPERVQVCVLGLLLRDNGYQCESGALWFVESKERVDVEFTNELVERTLSLVGEMRTIAASMTAPPPLVADRKCPRCSLVGICLPDEHNALLARSERPARRLTPRDEAARPLYVTEPGSVVGTRAGRVEVRLKERVVASARPIDVSQVAVFGNVQVTTQALRDCFSRDVPVMFFSSGGWLDGVATGMPSKHVELRRRQVIVGGQRGVDPARAFVEGKIRNCRTLLRRNGRPAPPEVVAKLGAAAVTARDSTVAASLLGIEGAAARSYFGAFPSMLRPELSLPGEPFSFEGRNRRPPKDAVNCLLSFVYALLVKDLVAVTIAVGFDPYLGLYHRSRFGRPALALDLAEEFRPLIGDSVVINLINNGEIRPSQFVVRAGGVALTSQGRKAVIASYERRLDVELTHPVFGYTITYRRVLEVQARILAAWLLQEIPDYLPVVTR